MKLQPGDTLLLYTDGVTEAMDHHNNLFDEERLVDSLQQIKGLPLESILKEVHADLKKFAAGAPQSDDITMLALRYNGAKK
jgi:sigma-B regulation protein RsbU (phosphoserine phosphatase)